MSSFTRSAGLSGLLLALVAALAPPAPAATPKEVERSLKAGTDALKARYARGVPAAAPGVAAVAEGGDAGIGPTCLVGLALLEAGVPANDPAVKAITAGVRDASYSQNRTYQISLCLLYLDRYGDPNDVPLIQMLASRLLAGQTTHGGWSYQCTHQVGAEDLKRLRAMKADQPAGKLHPEVERYAGVLAAARNQPGAVGAGTGGNDDNSNTQFGVLALWAARKHGMPADWMNKALDLIEKRFMASQDARTGNWAYSGPAITGPGNGSPSMYCAGLLGMATGIARREDRRPKDPPKPMVPGKPDPNKGDPFYNPPAPKEPAKKAAPRPSGPQDIVIQRGFAGLGLALADQVRAGLLTHNAGGHGTGDLYFLWSLERVGVIYGVDKIGGIDWYDVGSTVIVRTQDNNGMWNVGGYSGDVNTAFAVLFLCKSNLARDLSGKVQKDPTSTEMRAGTGPSAVEVLPDRPSAPASPPPVLSLPNPTGDESVTMASTLLKATGGDWKKLLGELRDTKGPKYTRALVLATTHLQGERKKVAREALAERLCRMTPATLREMLKADEAELRRGAALACAMKDDKAHVPDLIAVLTDEDDSVTRAAKAGLKSLTGKDFGPPAVASPGQKALAASAWREWYATEKK